MAVADAGRWFCSLIQAWYAASASLLPCEYAVDVLRLK
jgi:hypothetical protein